MQLNNNNNITLHQISINLPNNTKHGLQIIKKLREREEADGLSIVYYYLEIPSVEIAKYLIQTGLKLTTRNVDEETALHVVTKQGYLNIIQWLLFEKQMNVSDLSGYDGTPLHIAAKFGHFNIVKWLINNADININQRNYNGLTPLLFSYKYIDIAKYFVYECKADYNISDYANQTFLHVAAKEGNLEIVKWLVEDLKMDINAQDYVNETVMHLSYDHPDIVEYLLQQGADYNLTSNVGESILHVAATRWKPETVKVIIENCDLDINMQNKFGDTALYMGTASVNVIKVLVEIGKADVNITNHLENKTALHMASYKGHLESVKYLVENTNADVNAQDKDGNTALHLATRYLEVVQYLVIKVDVNIKNNAGQNVLEKVKNEYDKSDHNDDGKHPYVLDVVRFRNVHEWLINNVNFTTTSEVDSTMVI